MTLEITNSNTLLETTQQSQPLIVDIGYNDIRSVQIAVESDAIRAENAALAAETARDEAVAQVNVPTDLAYDIASRVLSSSTGADATLPLVSSGAAGLAPASGGGTTNFLRADGTWSAPGVGAITYADATLQNDVELTANNTWYSGPSITIGAGTWLVFATGHYRRNSTTAAGVVVRVWNGSAAVANGGASHPSLNGSELQVPAFAPVVLTGSTTLTLQMLATTGGAGISYMKAQTQSSAQGTIATRICAIRLA